MLKYSFESADFDNEANVKIFEDYYINAKVGFQATGKIDLIVTDTQVDQDVKYSYEKQNGTEADGKFNA